MEMADGIVINKADGDNVDEARRAATHYRNALQLFPMPESGIRPSVLTCSGFYDIGIREVWDMVVGYLSQAKENGAFDARRSGQQKYWLYETLDEHIRHRLYNAHGMAEKLKDYEQLLLSGKMTSFVAANKVLEYFDSI